MPAGVPRADEVAVDASVLLFTALVAVFTGVLFGIIPAVRATNSGSMTIAGFGRRTTAGVSHQRVSGLLVAAEVALAVLLVISAMLLVRSFTALRAVEPGFQTAHVIAARVSPPASSYNEVRRLAALYTTILERMAALPGVQSVAAVDRLPLAQTVWGLAARVEGQFEDATRPLPTIDHLQTVTPRYFEAMGIPVRGRAFTDADRADQVPVAIVSESVRRRFWPNGDAIGKRVGYPFASPWMTIVGVVPDTKQDSLSDTTSMSMYVPWQQRTGRSDTEMWVLARSAGDPSALGTTIRLIMQDVDRSVPVSDVRTMEAVLSSSLQKARFTVVLVGAFAAAAVLLGAVGIYGVMSYVVGQRTQEMGVRLALGAPASGVIALVVGRAARLALAGGAGGLLAAMVATRSLGALLYGVSATDPLTFVAVPVLFLGVAVLASYAPALRATRVDPARALRAD
jgi:putative ABC transport system permease protein